MDECGRQNRFPGSPPQSNSDPIDAACPTHTVETGERMYVMVS